jgi:hypothetical protein
MYSEHKRAALKESTRLGSAEAGEIALNRWKSRLSENVQPRWTLGGPFGHS